jgi:hypothetical protein
VKPERRDDFTKSWFIWDIITLADLRGFATEVEAPRPDMGDDFSLQSPAVGAGKINWITAVDSERLWADLFVHLDEFQQTHDTSRIDNQNSTENDATEAVSP